VAGSGAGWPRLELNSLGTAESRQAYRSLLVDYFSAHREALDADSQRRLGQNPLRILDSKNPAMQALIAAAPSITDHLDPESAEHFAALCGGCWTRPGRLTGSTRGWCAAWTTSRTVFEWLTDRLGAQAAVCSGGRYDGLVEQLGGRPTPAIGWALGMERLVELVRDGAPPVPAPHAYLIGLGDAAQVAALALAETLRDSVPGLRLVSHCGGGSLKAAMKKADRSGAGLALILGEEELAAGRVLSKPLRSDEEQQPLEHAALEARLREWVAAGG
jgi:histidyl-tRNA synthetase